MERQFSTFLSYHEIPFMKIVPKEKEWKKRIAEKSKSKEKG